MRSSAWRPAGLVRYAAAALIFILAIALWLHGIVAHPESRLPSGFDDTTGWLHGYWAAGAEHRTPFDFTHDPLNGAPEGFARQPAAVVANDGMQTAFVWFLRGPLTLVGAWNVFLLLGVFATGMAMFALLDRLRCTFGAAMFAGLLFAFSPYEVERTEAGHLGLVQNWVFVLVLAALLRLGAARTFVWSAAVGLSLGLAFYITAYQGLLASLMVFVFLAIELVRKGGRWRTAALGGLAYLVALVSLTPVFVLFWRERSSVSASYGHSVNDLGQYAATLGAYLVPSPRNPLLRRIGGPVHWLLGLHPGDLTERTLFFGYTTLVLAAVAAVLLYRRDARLRVTDSRWRTAVFAAVLAPASFVLSFAPSYRVGSVSIPTPSWLIAHLTTYWRVYSRFGLLTGMSLAILAALALTALASRPGRFWRLLPGLAIAALALELLPAGVPNLDASFRPQWVTWLASAPRGIVATYPSLGLDAPILERQDEWYQQFHGDPLFAISEATGVVPDSPTQAIRYASRDLGAPVTPRILATEGVRYVVVHDDAYRARGQGAPTLDPGSFTLLKSFPDVRIFSVHAPHVDLARALRAQRFVIATLQGRVPPTIDYGSGFYPPEPYQGSTGRWLGGTGQLELHNPGPGMAVVLSGLGFSNAEPRLLEVQDSSGRVLARQRVPAYAVPLALGPFSVPHGSSTLTLFTVPGADPLGGSDPRTASVFLSGLELKPLPAYAGA